MWNSYLETISNAPPKKKQQSVQALVHPILNYRASIWVPHTQANILKLEKVNKRAARFVTGNYTLEHGQTEKNLSLLNWPTLQEQRKHHKLTLMYKINNNIIHAPTEDLHSTTQPQETSQLPCPPIIYRRPPSLLLPQHHQTLESASPNHKNIHFPHQL